MGGVAEAAIDRAGDYLGDVCHRPRLVLHGDYDGGVRARDRRYRAGYQDRLEAGIGGSVGLERHRVGRRVRWGDGQRQGKGEREEARSSHSPAAMSQVVLSGGSSPGNLRHPDLGSLVLESPRVRHGHRDAILVRRLDHLGVADGASGLDDCDHASLAQEVDVVAEREEAV